LILTVISDTHEKSRIESFQSAQDIRVRPSPIRNRPPQSARCFLQISELYINQTPKFSNQPLRIREKASEVRTAPPGSLAKLGRNRNPTVAAGFSCGGLAAENSFRCEEARRQELAAPIGEEEKVSLTPWGSGSVRLVKKKNQTHVR